MLELKPGDRFGRYKVVDVIGEGAMARVFRVFAPQLKDTAALKLSHEPVGDADAAQRMLREVAIVQSLTNRHVPRIYDSGQGPDGHVYILMEELDGQQLDRWHDFDQAMPPAQAAFVIQQACLGLAEAHAAGIVHRDIKPENIWVEPDHNVKVLDFGLARSWGGPEDDELISANVTMTNMVMGTPRYMQPEQLKTTRLTPASDIYSLGTILYELLTGHTVYFPDRPFSEVREDYRHQPMEWLNAHDIGEPVPMKRYPECVDVPGSLEWLVLKCLSKKPENRPQHAGELANKLGEILHYDLGAATATVLRIELPYGGYEDKLIFPGSHRIGRDASCEVRLSAKDVPPQAAVLDWNGLPDLPELRPVDDHVSIEVGGRPVAGRHDLKEGDVVKIAGFTLRFEYPPQ